MKPGRDRRTLGREALPPPRPKSLRVEELGFHRLTPVRWFHPLELLRTGIRAALADVFGGYADRRELQAALHPPKAPPDYSERSELWVDYVADIGDGFNATFSIASLLARKQLELELEPGRERHSTHQGRVLIMGGDQVYPTATAEEYRNRTVGPYAAALPWVKDPQQAPHLFAIPGNHDWYDGLTAFLRQFAQGRWIGGWKTQQRRSYFALKLPHNYWLWGIDIQLRADVDTPQLEYFEAQAELMQPGDKLVLCTPEPSWIKDGQKADLIGFENLQFLLHLAKNRGAFVVLVLAGDLHHYCRYFEPESECMFVTAGFGGAFLHGTHALPEELAIRACKTSHQDHKLHRACTYPSQRDSELQVLRVGQFPFTNHAFAMLWAGLWAVLGFALSTSAPGDLFDVDQTFFARLAANRPLTVALSERPLAIYFGAFALFAWVMFRVLLGGRSRNLLPRWGMLAIDLLPWAGSGTALLLLLGNSSPSPLGSLVRQIFQSPAALSVMALIVLGNVAFVAHDRPWVKALLGSVHAAFHLLWWLATTLLVVGSTASCCANYPAAEASLPVVWWLVSSLVAGLLSALVFALFLWFAGCYLPGQLNEVSSALSSEDFKGFCRLHFDAAGGLKVYPVGLDRVPCTWRANPDPDPEQPLCIPEHDEPLTPHLVEVPYRFDPDTRRWATERSA